jgi:hypothetical protein
MASADTRDNAQVPNSALAPAHTEAEGIGTGEPVEVAPEELNAWRRGFTPQAEIWNGRLAMLGLSLGIATLLLLRLSGTH